jgi:hypothetical protein
MKLLALSLALSAAAVSDEPITLPPDKQAVCAAEGGCYVVTASALARMLNEARTDERATARRDLSCRNSI